MSYFIERTVPRYFLRQLGTYLQTAAHIELAVWHIVMIADGVDPFPALAPVNYLKLRKSTTDLKTRFKAAADLVPDGFRVRMLDLSRRIEDGTQTRNTAAHGAFFLESGTGSLRVEHYFTIDTEKGKEWHFTDGDISDRDVMEALREADHILENCMAIREELYQKVFGRPLNEAVGA